MNTYRNVGILQGAQTVDATNPLNVTGNIVITTGSNAYYLLNKQMFSAAASVSAANAGSDNPLILFTNPNGSGKTAVIVKITMGTTIANVAVNTRLYANPTITSNGTTLTNRQRYVGQTPASGSVLTYTLPTISALGNLIHDGENGQNSNSYIFSEDYTAAVAPNNSILITGNPLSNNRNVAITVVWVEI